MGYKMNNIKSDTTNRNNVINAIKPFICQRESSHAHGLFFLKNGPFVANPSGALLLKLSFEFLEPVLNVKSGFTDDNGSCLATDPKVGR